MVAGHSDPGPATPSPHAGCSLRSLLHPPWNGGCAWRDGRSDPRCRMPSPYRRLAVHELTMLMMTYGREGSWRSFGGQLEVFVDGLRGDLVRRGGVEPRGPLRQPRVTQTPCGSNLWGGAQRRRVGGSRPYAARKMCSPGRVSLRGRRAGSPASVLGVRDEDLHALTLGGYGVVDPLQQSLAALYGAYHDGLGYSLRNSLARSSEIRSVLFRHRMIFFCGSVGAFHTLREGAAHGPDLVLQLRYWRRRTAPSCRRRQRPRG